MSIVEQLVAAAGPASSTTIAVISLVSEAIGVTSSAAFA